jgi:hypothetical protein
MKYFILASALTIGVVPAHAQTLFDGMYAGGYVANVQPGNATDIREIGIATGYRLSLAETFVLGLEASAGLGLGYDPYYDSLFAIEAGAHAGFAIQNVLVFASAGIGQRGYQGGYNDSQADKYVATGLGAELAANDWIHLRMQAQYQFSSDDSPVSSGVNTTRLSFAVLGQVN